MNFRMETRRDSGTGETLSFYAGRIYRITTERSSVEVSGKEKKNINAARTLEYSVCMENTGAVSARYVYAAM